MKYIDKNKNNNCQLHTAITCIIVCVILMSLMIAVNYIVYKYRNTPKEENNDTENIIETQTINELEELEEVTEVEIKPYCPTNRDISAIAKLLYVVCADVESEIRQQAVVWSVLNRFDVCKFTSIHALIDSEKDYDMYKDDVPETEHYVKLARDVAMRWYAEKLSDTTTEINRILPKEYMFFFFDYDDIQFTVSFESFDYWEFDE